MINPDAAWWTPHTGTVAVLCYAVVVCVQLVTLWKVYRTPDSTTTLRRTVRPMVTLCAAVSAVLWIVYGARFDAPALDSANTLVLLGLSAVSAVCIRLRIWRRRSVVGAALCLGLIALLVSATAQVVLGFAAAVVSVLLWLPAAVSGIGGNNTTVVSREAWLLPTTLAPMAAVVTHAAWFIYGIGMGDVWLWLAAPGVVACAVLAKWSVGVMSRVTPLTQTEQCDMRINGEVDHDE